MQDEMEPEVAKPAREFREIRSKYEFVVVAAREAERLNDYYRNRALQPDRKVTLESTERVRLEKSRLIYEEQTAPSEEPRRETTYFFGT